MTGGTQIGLATVAVQVAYPSFDPVSVSIPRGTTVRWMNKDQFAHTVTIDAGGSFDLPLAALGTVSYTFAVSGTFRYLCEIHPEMKGTVFVI
jgi:plastocyanin